MNVQTNKIRKPMLSLVLQFIRNVVLICFAIMTLYPFLNVLATSLSDYSAYVRNPAMFIPEQINLAAYKNILSSPLVYSSYKNTIIITVLGTTLNLVFTVLMAYPLSKTFLRGNRIVMTFVLITMFFNGGMIPNYVLIRNLKLINTYWALILPGTVSAYNLILMKNFFSAIPDSLEESAKIDGASDIRILASIILPLSLPSIATIGLFYAVGNWNIFFRAMLYTTERGMWTLQLLLREMINESDTSLIPNTAETGAVVYTQTLKATAIIVTVLPILLVYPFLQKYFVKGVMIGAVKG